MLDQLVESKSNADENTRRSKFLLVTLIVMLTVAVSLWGQSLFSKEFDVSGDFELAELIAPVAIEEEPPPEPEKEKPKDPNVDVRKEIIQNMMESPTKPPEKTSVEKQTIPPRDPNRYTVKGDTNFTAAQGLPPDYKGPVNTGGTGSDSGGGGETTDTGGTPPPPPPKKITKPISGGVLNGKATSLPTPPYPPAARAVRAGGSVSVQVLIDESGRVVSASAVSGHPLLRPAAQAAALRARFSPTQLSGQPVKVSGVITYNFVP